MAKCSREHEKSYKSITQYNSKSETCRDPLSSDPNKEFKSSTILFFNFTSRIRFSDLRILFELYKYLIPEKHGS